MTTPQPLVVEPLEADRFAPFGTVIAPTPDGTPFGDADAMLVLGNGTPRFYTMTIPARGLTVRRITRHRRVTQVLASAGGNVWYLAVAAPTPDGAQPQPEPTSIRAFAIPGDTAVMLGVGTWHAGPMFAEGEQSFFNLELADTNIVDHDTTALDETFDIALELDLSALA